MSEKKVDVLEDNRYCSLCGSIHSITVINGRYGIIVKCNNCNLMYRKTKIGEYPTEFLGEMKHFSSQIETKQALQVKDFSTSFSVIQEVLGSIKGKKLLEMGSYYGHLLNHARQLGFDVIGLDPDSRLAEIARERFQLDIIDKFLRDANFPDQRFDAVVMFHVIEHLNDPLQELKEIIRILKNGGVFVAETPRFDTMWFNLLREHERSVIPEHFTYFTKKTLQQTLEAAGFEIIKIDSVGRTLTMDRLSTNISKMLGSKLLAAKIMSLSERLNLEKFSCYLNMGDMMRIYARKPL